MSDEQIPPPPAVETLTSEQISTYIKSVRTQSCPSCGTNTWAIQTTAPGQVKFDLYYKAKKSAKGGLYPTQVTNPAVIPVINTTCNTCGLIQTYQYAMVKKWIREQNK